jgi:hypothetical protein
VTLPVGLAGEEATTAAKALQPHPGLLAAIVHVGKLLDDLDDLDASEEGDASAMCEDAKDEQTS